jgi:hypothetical protein
MSSYLVTHATKSGVTKLQKAVNNNNNNNNNNNGNHSYKIEKYDMGGRVTDVEK